MDLSQLNAAQRDAVTGGEGAHLVIAGAGTGKTRTLVHRVAWLITQGVPAPAIVLLTFTRRAAHEMLDRVADLAGADAVHVRGGTFHSFGHQQLRRFGDRLGIGTDFTILDRADSSGLVGLVRSELGVGGRGRRFAQSPTLLKILSRQVNTGSSLEAIVEEQYPQYLDDLDDIARIGERYTELKRHQNVLDFDDLLVLFAELLREHPGPRRKIARWAHHVLVDEYQDTNPVQGQIACLLATEHGNITVVGDEAQSIYAFRGATVDNILDFPELFPGCTVHKLEHNYRSSQPVLELANGILESASQGYEKHLYTDVVGGSLPRVVDLPEDADQPAYIVREVLGLREEGVRLRDMAVLFRSSFHANLLELELAKADIPFRKFGGIQFIEAAHVKDVFALLRIVANPRDGLAWLRVLQWFEGIGTKTARKVLDQVLDAPDGRLDPSPFKGRKYHPSLVTLARTLDTARDLAGDLDALVEHLLEYYADRADELYDDAWKRKRDLDTLGVLSARYPDLTTFLAEVALEPPSRAQARPTDDEEEWLTLSTIHSAKGLEWHAVFVLNLADGQFPSGYSLDDPEGLEEERRLLYVATTRAERELHLLRPRFVRARWGGMGVGPGCTLLEQIPDLEDRVEVVRGRAPEVELDKDPGIVAAEERLQRFLDYYDG